MTVRVRSRRVVIPTFAVVLAMVAGTGSVSSLPWSPASPGGDAGVVAATGDWIWLPVMPEPPVERVLTAPETVPAPVVRPATPRRHSTGRPARPAPRRAACPAPPAAPAPSAIAAQPVGSSISVYASPDSRRPIRTMSNPTREGFTLTTLVRERRGDWLRVQLPVRPNGYTGWVPAAQLRQYRVPGHVVVELCARRLTLYRSGVPAMRIPVAVGKPGTPTPTGSFFIDFHYPTGRSGGAYGPWLLSVAGFSNVLQTFAGGIGQIALHGTNAPAKVGTAASHGCVRLHNDNIVAIQPQAGPGTPVTIVP